uniref:Uncharacterized protein n=1 Tax=Arundo donax TaxID=35708 RepID=A0A0A9FEN2_ARUDO
MCLDFLDHCFLFAMPITILTDVLFVLTTLQCFGSRLFIFAFHHIERCVIYIYNLAWPWL